METWLTAEISDSALFIPNYVINRKDRQPTETKSKHGGVLVAVTKSIPFETVNLKLTHDDFGSENNNQRDLNSIGLHL